MIPKEAPQAISAASFYLADAGARYYSYQSRFGDVTGRIIARKFYRCISSSDRVLDFGCGGGFVLKAIECERFGVEINPLARAEAVRNGVSCFESIEEVDSESVDVVISHHSLEHVPSPLATLRLLSEKLKPGGTLMLVVPIDDWRSQRRFDPEDVNHHLYTWTPLLLGTLLTEAGFDTGTLSISIGTNGWIRGYQKWYGRIPEPLFDLASYLWCIRRRTREIRATVRKAVDGSEV